MQKSFLIWLLLVTPHFLWGVTIEYTNLTSSFMPTKTFSKKKSYYKITSTIHVEKYIKKTKLLLFNRRQYMLKNNYYIEGKFKTHYAELNYKKAYILGGKVYLFDVDGKINGQKVKAKEVSFDGYKSYTLKKCEVRTKFKVYRRRKFIIIID